MTSQDTTTVNCAFHREMPAKAHFKPGSSAARFRGSMCHQNKAVHLTGKEGDCGPSQSVRCRVTGGAKRRRRVSRADEEGNLRQRCSVLFKTGPVRRPVLAISVGGGYLYPH